MSDERGEWDMLAADRVREGMLLIIGGKLYKVLSTEFGGAARAGRIVHLWLQGIPDGVQVERSFQGNESLETATLDRYAMVYLYTDGSNFYFMNKDTYEQYTISREVVGQVAPYLKENIEIQVEFYKGKPVNIVFPGMVELKVTSAPPGIRDLESTTYKKVTLENEMEVLVPQFIKEGDIVKIDVRTGKYVDRIKK